MLHNFVLVTILSLFSPDSKANQMNVNPREVVAWILVGILVVSLTGALVIITVSVTKHNNYSANSYSDDVPNLECKMDDNPCYELHKVNHSSTDIGVQETHIYDTV